jgi:hypothetical protein
LNASVTVSDPVNSACTARSWKIPRTRSAETIDSAWLAAAPPACTMKFRIPS